MSGLAEYAMLGRRQAIIVVLLSGFFPLLYFISAAVVALVNLRKDSMEGFLVLLWALLPAGLHWMLGDPSPVFVLLGVTVLAHLLKADRSWMQIILLSLIPGIATQISLNWQPAYVQEVETIVNEAVRLQLSQGADIEYSAEQLVDLLLSFYGAYHTLAMVLCLMLARRWQAVLYNPGGFQTEFHQLRFDPRVMVVLVLLITAGIMNIRPVENWLMIFCLPPMFEGLALIHYLVTRKAMGSFWLIPAYIILFLVSPVIIAMGIIDSFLNIRKRLK